MEQKGQSTNPEVRDFRKNFSDPNCPSMRLGFENRKLMPELLLKKALGSKYEGSERERPPIGPLKSPSSALSQ